jgi:hypothetical protein
MSDSNFDGVLDPDAGWPDIPQASTKFVVLGGQGGPLNEQAKTLAARTKKLKADVENISGGGFGGQYKNLIVTVSGVGYQGTITANRLVIESVDFKTKTLRNVNVAFNGANGGVNGIDISSMAADSWYYLYVIYNPTSEDIATLISLSYSSPTLPSGYTYCARVGSAKVPATAGSFIKSKRANDETIMYSTSGTGYNTIVSNDTSEGVWTSKSTSAYAPPTACAVILLCQCRTGGVMLVAARNASWQEQEITVSSTTFTPTKLVFDQQGIIYFYTSSAGGTRIAVVGYLE